MARLGERTGRTMHIVDYTGHPEAQRVLVVMGSGAETVVQTVAALVERGERVGVVQVRLYRPFPTRALLDALPATVRTVGVLDRTKEPGSIGEPLYLDVVAALAEAHADGERPVMPRVTGGRYGLSSKEFTPAMVAGVFAELAREQPRRRFTVGIDDDVSGTSVDYDPSFDIESPDTFRAVFFGLGSDGTVSANKNTIKILGSEEGLHAQGVLRLRLEEVGFADRVASTLRARSHPRPLPGDCGQFHWLPPVPVPRQSRHARSGRPGRDAAAELSASGGQGLGRAAAAGPGTDPGQADHALRRRRRPDRARGRARRADQHRPADMLLRDLGRAAPRAGDRPDQGIGGKDVRKPRRRRAEQRTGRSGRRRERVAPDRGARRWSPPRAHRHRPCPSPRRSSSAPLPRR